MPTSLPGPRSTTSYAVLGLLSVRTWTTYELTKQVQRSLRWFWPRAERRIYDEPKALVAAGLATARKEYTGQRPRTVYAITDDGRAALRDWLGAPPAPRTLESEALLKIFFADAGSLEELIGTLRAVEAEAVDRLTALAAMAEQSAEGLTAFPERGHISALGLRLHLQDEAAVLGWARWALAQVAEWRSSTDPAAWDARAELARLVADVEEILSADADLAEK